MRWNTHPGRALIVGLLVMLMMPGLARKVRVVADWTTAMLFPRDLSQLGALGRRTPLDGGTG